MSFARSRLSTCILVCFALSACDESDLPDNGGPPAYPSARHGLRDLVVTPGSTVIALSAPDLLVAYKDDQRLAWTHRLPPNQPVIAAPVVSADSTTFVLTARQLRALAPNGELKYSVTLPFDGQKPASKSSSPVRHSLVVLPDSSAVVADGERTLICVRGGKIVWRHALPAPAKMTARPVAGPNGSVYVRTSAWIYCVGHQGALRWRVPLRSPR